MDSALTRQHQPVNIDPPPPPHANIDPTNPGPTKQIRNTKSRRQGRQDCPARFSVYHGKGALKSRLKGADRSSPPSTTFAQQHNITIISAAIVVEERCSLFNKSLHSLAEHNDQIFE
ncbi:hypothetical protein [Absidia glauca]|uniref:Uncharacterized protein n=1 Tax=Absidia glauca TaxID=4829 RepID=A0A163JA35_ABSGL|nr:hypothetical protein [Absidia glauca]